MTMAQRLAAAPWLFPERAASALRPAANDQAIDDQDDDRADDGGDEAGTFTGAVPPDGVPDPAGDERARDAQQYSDDAPARVAPGHQELGDQACDSADDNPANDSVMFHCALLPIPLSFMRHLL